MDEDRAVFEQWVTRGGRPGVHVGRSRIGGVYTDNRVAAKWAAWQAALRYARAQSTPQPTDGKAVQP